MRILHSYILRLHVVPFLLGFGVVTFVLVMDVLFDYLDLVARQLADGCPDVPVWRQQRSMTDADREDFLARFEPDSEGVALAVLGGSFAEGIDLPGRRLIGAFVATLGLPQVNAVNERLRQVLDAELGAGFEYTYLYPGLRKVVQAAGRVIRTTSDHGTLYLIDERFERAAVRKLLPSWWSPRRWQVPPPPG